MKPSQPSTRGVLLVLAMLCVVLAQSCGGTKAIQAYSDAIPVHALIGQPIKPYAIKTDDKVSVSIWQHDDLSIGSIFGIYNSSEGYGKWVMVDEQGNVTLPKLGIFPMAGLTQAQAADTLRKQLSTFLVDPIVVVKVLNREVTVLGEVRTPGNYLLDKQDNNLCELIGRAQGFTDYANVRSIMLQRNGRSYLVNLDELNASERDALQVMAGDIIDVPPLRGKRLDKKAPTLIPFASVMTAIAIAFTTFIN